jgi:hypothetical protein
MASSIPIPKVIRKVQEKKFGRSWRWIWLSICSLGAIIVMLMLSFLAPFIIKLVLWTLIIAFIVVFFKFIKNDETLDRSVLMYNYFMRSMRGQTVVAKYTCTVPFLQQVVPLVAVHANGIIEFTGKRWGILMRIDPQRVSDDDLDSHIAKVKDVIESLFGDLILKTFVCSRTNNAKPIEQDLIKKMNDKDKTNQQRQHLYSIYQDIRGNIRPLIEWRFFVFASIGIHEDLESADRVRQTHIPGLENKMRVAGMHVIPLTDPNEVSISYRQCFTQLKIQ